MHDIINAVILGVVEGVTEFLPVSSTGHLILTGHLLGFTGAKADTFEIFIQLGAILAVVAYFRGKFIDLVKPGTRAGFSGWRGLLLLGLTTAPALVVGKLGHDAIKAHLFTPLTVAIGLAAGALWILATESALRRKAGRSLDALGWRAALGVGLFQCLAMWPGMSRSASTILGGMICGLDRKSATEYSFFAAVPVLVLAGLYDLYKNWALLGAADLPLFATGFIVSFLSAWLAIRFFIRYGAGHTLAAFAWYRLAVAGLVLWLVR